MPTISQETIWRGDTKIGYWEGGGRLYDEHESPVGWFEDGRVYREGSTNSIGYVDGDYIYWSDGTEVGRLDDNFEHVARGDSYYSPLLCAAITLLYGQD